MYTKFAIIQTVAKKLIVPAGGTLVTCCSCQRRLLFKKASVELNLVVQFEVSDVQSLSATIFPSLLKKLYGEKCIDNAVESLMLCNVIWNLFTVGSLQFCIDSTIASLEANENQPE